MASEKPSAAPADAAKAWDPVQLEELRKARAEAVGKRERDAPSPTGDSSDQPAAKRAAPAGDCALHSPREESAPTSPTATTLSKCSMPNEPPKVIFSEDSVLRSAAPFLGGNYGLYQVREWLTGLESEKEVETTHYGGRGCSCGKPTGKHKEDCRWRTIGEYHWRDWRVIAKRAAAMRPPYTHVVLIGRPPSISAATVLINQLACQGISPICSPCFGDVVQVTAIERMRDLLRLASLEAYPAKRFIDRYIIIPTGIRHPAPLLDCGDAPTPHGGETPSTRLPKLSRDKVGKAYATVAKAMGLDPEPFSAFVRAMADAGAPEHRECEEDWFWPARLRNCLDVAPDGK